MEGFYAGSAKEAVDTVLSLIDKRKKIGFGWSTTNFQIGLIDEIRKRGYNIYDRFEIADRCVVSGNFDELIKTLDKTYNRKI